MSSKIFHNIFGRVVEMPEATQIKWQILGGVMDIGQTPERISALNKK